MCRDTRQECGSFCHQTIVTKIRELLLLPQGWVTAETLAESIGVSRRTVLRELTAAKRIDPAVMVTHIGGLDAAAETTLNLPKIPGGKKRISTHLTMPLIALTDLRAKGAEDARYTALADIVDAHNGLWCPEAEEYLLANFHPEDEGGICHGAGQGKTGGIPHGTTPQSDCGTGQPERQHQLCTAQGGLPSPR